VRDEPSFVVANNQAFYNQLTDVQLQLRFFIRDFIVDQHSVHKLVQHFLAIYELREQVVVVDVVLTLFLKGLDYSQALVKTAQDAFTDFHLRHLKQSNGESLDLL
jgi:hypothetical protein